MTPKCKICGLEHDELPLCFGVDAPWPAMVSEEEFDRRVQLTSDVCIVDQQSFFIRGHVEIPIHESPESLCFSVWSSLSEDSFRRISTRWNAPDRAMDSPYFGWLCSALPVYPSTIHLRLSVQSRAPGFVPLFSLEPTEHPLALDQRHGITVKHWHELAHCLMHDWLQ